MAPNHRAKVQLLTNFFGVSCVCPCFYQATQKKTNTMITLTNTVLKYSTSSALQAYLQINCKEYGKEVQCNLNYKFIHNTSYYNSELPASNTNKQLKNRRLCLLPTLLTINKFLFKNKTPSRKTKSNFFKSANIFYFHNISQSL